jgi:L-ascorbate metabolism protein UlaG (beta-lactamase superfamily)
MGIKVTWLSHSGFQLEIASHKVLIDPFLSGNPLAPFGADALEADFILLTHGHGDHISDTPAIAKRTGATVVGMVEIAGWIGKQGVENTVGNNMGGGTDHGFGRVEFTPAWHSSSLPDGSYGGMPAGIIIFADGLTIYHAGDTALFSDMQLLGDKGIDVAIVPIGDFYTMGPEDSIKAVKYLKPQFVMPMHYNTFPVLQQDAAAWADRIHKETGAEPIVLDPGGAHEF